MKDKLIIFGAGYYGQSAYWKLKGKFDIICFVDNNDDVCGKQYEGVNILPADGLPALKTGDVDIVVCAGAYYDIGHQLADMGLYDFYVMIEGFLYHTDSNETMMPCELLEYAPFAKTSSEKNILFVQNTACIRTHKIAETMKACGYKVYLLYTVAPPIMAYAQFAMIYDGIWTFTSMRGIEEFIESGDFDVIHCSNEPDILANIVRNCGKPVVADTHDMQSIRADIGIEALALEYLANTECEGNMYASERVAQIASDKYGNDKARVFAIDNLMMDQVQLSGHLFKLSDADGAIHCVYEGGIVGEDKMSHRYFDVMWKAIADQGIHIHFYAPNDLKLCERLEGISPNIHYEGNLSGEALIREMTQYDCGLALFNSNPNNRLHLESTSINKVYEYLNSGLPIAAYGINSLKGFVEAYGVGAEMDFGKNLVEQFDRVRKIKIDPDFLNNNELTMTLQADRLSNYYESIMTMEK